MKKYLLGLFLLGSLLHLVGLAYPRQAIFDEVHFGKFITAYCCTGERFFDIHPPPGKLLISGVAWLGGYRGGFSFDHIGQDYGSVPVTALRLVPAIMGIILPLIFFILLRQLGASGLIAFLGGLMLVFDNALLVQTRLIALDGTLLVATFGAISAALAGWPLVAGALVGLAVGTKFTGLAAVVVVSAIMFWQLFQNGHLRLWLLHVLLASLAAVVVYTGGWWIHWRLLPVAGSGDAWMAPTGNFLADTAKMHQQMLAANYNLTATHHDASPAWGWPLMRAPVYYWAGQGADIYFIGNPVIWWGSSLLFVVALGSLISKFRISHFGFRISPFWLPVLGFIVSYVPLLRVPRALFLYHYLTPLLFALLFGLLWLDKTRFFTNYQLPITRCLIVALLIGFVVISPLTYGLAIPGYQQLIFGIFPGWR